MEKLHRLAAVIVFILCIMEIQCRARPSAKIRLFPSRERSRQICGPSLTNAIQLVCDGRTQMMHKKSSEEVRGQEEYILEDETSTFPFRSRRLSRTLIPVRLRRQAETGGLYDECCKKACTIQEIEGYCLDN